MAARARGAPRQVRGPPAGSQRPTVQRRPNHDKDMIDRFGILAKRQDEILQGICSVGI